MSDENPIGNINYAYAAQRSSLINTFIQSTGSAYTSNETLGSNKLNAISQLNLTFDLNTSNSFIMDGFAIVEGEYFFDGRSNIALTNSSGTVFSIDAPITCPCFDDPFIPGCTGDPYSSYVNGIYDISGINAITVTLDSERYTLQAISELNTPDTAWQSSNFNFTFTTTTIVPIPPAMLLFASGLIGIFGLVKRWRMLVNQTG